MGADGWCEPLVATPRRPERKTWGSQIARLARLTHRPLMAWQRYVCDVALEEGEDGGRAYRHVVLSVPRQCGKSHLLFLLCMYRALTTERGMVAYNAQDSKSGNDIMGAGMSLLTDFGLDKQWNVTRYHGVSDPHIRVNNSQIKILSGSSTAGHGMSLDLAVLDEAWAYPSEEREQSFLPAMRTKEDAQYWVVSTVGDATSVYLRTKMDAGRKAVEDGLDTGIAYFEWGAPREANPDSPETWRSAIPALGFVKGDGGVLVTEEIIRHEREQTSDLGFRRASLNQWPIREVEPVIDWGVWDEQCSTSVEVTGELFLGLAADDDSVWLAVASGGVVELLGLEEDVAAAVESARALCKSHSVVGVVTFSYGPLVTDVRGMCGDVGVLHDTVPTPRYGAACRRFVDDLVGKRLEVRRHELLDSALSGALKKIGKAGGWQWEAAPGTGVSVGPLTAVTLAWDAVATNSFGSAGPSVIDVMELASEKSEAWQREVDLWDRLDRGEYPV